MSGSGEQRASTVIKADIDLRDPIPQTGLRVVAICIGARVGPALCRKRCGWRAAYAASSISMQVAIKLCHAHHHFNPPLARKLGYDTGSHA